MAAQTALRTEFLGASLKAAPATARPTPRAAPVQAFFSKKSPAKGTKVIQKEIKKAVPQVKKAIAPAKTQVKQAAATVKKAAPPPPKKAVPPPVKKAQTQVKKALPQVKKALPQQVKKALPKKVAPPPPVRKAVPQVKRAVSQVKKAGSKATKGWLGGVGGAQNLDKWYGPSRALYLPGGLLAANDVPSYLNGTLAGDYGYDPLSLGKDPAQVEIYRKYELLHARWAMLAAAGIIIPEGLQANGAALNGGTWFETGAEMLNGGTLNYFAVPWGIINNPLPLAAVVLVEVGLMGAVEKYRKEGSGPPGYAPGVGKFDSNIFNGLDELYPGGPFDPLKLASDPEVFEELKVKEIKNGRLAMISVLGFAIQSAVTGEGPYANWAKHVSDPFGYNLFTILGAEDRVPTL